jgi:hypothetical protein
LTEGFQVDEKFRAWKSRTKQGTVHVGAGYEALCRSPNLHDNVFAGTQPHPDDAREVLDTE